MTGVQTCALPISAQDGTPFGLAFSSDGTKAYIVGLVNDTIYQYTLSTPWDISTGTYASKSLSVAAQSTGPSGLAFSSDGTKAYVVERSTSNTIYQYTLSAAWDISTGSYASKSLVVAGQESNTEDLAFSSDGTKAYIVGLLYNTIFQYTLSTAWDISTGSYASKSLAAQDSNTYSLAFSGDGAKAYTLGSTSDRIYQYTLVD